MSTRIMISYQSSVGSVSLDISQSTSPLQVITESDAIAFANIIKPAGATLVEVRFQQDIETLYP